MNNLSEVEIRICLSRLVATIPFVQPCTATTDQNHQQLCCKN